MQQFHPEDIPCVTDVLSHPIEQRPDFSPPILRRYAILAKNRDRRLTHVEILGAVQNHLPDDSCRYQRSAIAMRNADEADTRLDEAAAKSQHSQDTQNAFRGNDHGMFETLYFHNGIRLGHLCSLGNLNDSSLQQIFSVERRQQLLRLGNVNITNPEMHPAILDIHGNCATSPRRLSFALRTVPCSRVANVFSAALPPDAIDLRTISIFSNLLRQRSRDLCSRKRFLRWKRRSGNFLQGKEHKERASWVAGGACCRCFEE